MGRKFKDNALTTLASSLTALSTTLTVATGDGDNFPAVTGSGSAGSAVDYFVITLENAAGDIEKIKVEHRASASDALGSVSYPLVRGYDGTTARAWSAGDSVDLRWERAVAQDHEDKIAAGAPGRAFGVKESTTTGLTFGYYGGVLNVDGVATTVNDGTVSLTGSQTNYVERTPAGAVSVNTTGFSADKLPMYTVTADASKITAITDQRMANLPTFGLISKDVAGGAGTTALTAAEARPEIIEFTGALTGNRVIELPNVKRPWIIYNNTSGSYTLTVKVNGQTGVAVTQGSRAHVYGNGTDIVAATSAVGDAEIGASTAQTLTDGANVAWALASGHVGNWTMGGNRTLDNPSGVKRGRTYVLNATQDATGGRTITFSSNYKGINGGAVPQPNPAATTTTSYLFWSPDGTVLQLIAEPVPVFGQCLLTKDGSNLKLSPLNGNLLTINGKVEVIPDAGVTLAVGALANTTLYYVYAYMNSGAMTLEASTTAYATQAGTNLKIKSGDATRTLVGMCYLQSGAFVLSLQKKLVRSWFNEPGVIGYSAGLNGTTGSATFAEISTSFRLEALLWANETANAVLTGYGNSGAANYVGARVVRGAAAAVGNDVYEGYNTVYGGLSSQVVDTPGEGYHYWNCYLYSGTGTSALVDADMTLTTSRGA